MQNPPLIINPVVDAEQFPGLLQGDLASLARRQVQDADMVLLELQWVFVWFLLVQ